MALVTPIGIAIPAFDATQPQVFSFNVQGGDQVVGNILTIIDNNSGTTVYTNQVTSYVYRQTLPANTLSNNGYYAFNFITINANGDRSVASSNVTFRTFTTPTLAFTNIPSTHIIESGNYSFTAQYNQIEGELLNTIYFYLYDATQTQIQVSEAYTSTSNPPINFTHQFSGFIDDERYYIRAVATTIYNTVVDTGYIEININYSYEGAYFAVTAINNPRSGYVQVSNNITEIDGQVYDINNIPIAPTFISDNSLMLDNGEYLLWEDGFSFANNAFVQQRWWKPMWWGQQVRMSNLSNLNPTEGDGRSLITIEYKRGISSGTQPKDYLVAKGYVNGSLYFTKVSNLVSPLNNLSVVNSFLTINNNSIDLVLDVTNSQANVLDFEGNSNVEFNKVTDLYWEDESKASYIQDVDNINAPPTVKYISNIRLMNSIVDGFYVSHDTNQTIPYVSLPEWDNYTIMRADFNNNLRAGNVDWVLSNINKIKVKRKRAGASEPYVTLYVQEINNVYDLSFYYRDYYVPSGYEFEYAMIPCVNEDEQAYFTTQIKTYFDGLFVSDKDKTMKLYGNVLINSSNDNIMIGMAQPYNQTYPVIIQNPNVQYRTATFQGDILGMTDSQCGNFALTPETRVVITDQKREWDKFLCNGKAKIIKDWNGNIIMGRVTSAPSYSYSQASGNSKPTITFGVTEVGEYDNQTSMYQQGLVDALT